MTPGDNTTARGSRGRRPTQRDIAQAAGVSQATVSLVLNNHAGADVRIGEETIERVRAAIRELGYVANPVARSLAGGDNRLLGIYTFESVFPTDTRDFYFPFLTGIEEEAERLGYDLLLFTSAAATDETRRRRMYRGDVNRLALADGCILLGRQQDPEEIARLRDEGFPFVFVGRREIPGGEISYVAADYGAATEALVADLLGRGHRRIAYLRSGPLVEPGRDRQAGYRGAHEAAGFELAPELLVDLGDEAVPASLLDDLLAAGATAVACEQQALAERLWQQAAERGLQIPRDLSVVTLGDTIGVRGVEVDWTSFVIQRHEMGAQALRLLTEALQDRGAGPRHVVLPCPLLPGTTVAAPRDAGEAR